MTPLLLAAALAHPPLPPAPVHYPSPFPVPVVQVPGFPGEAYPLPPLPAVQRPLTLPEFAKYFQPTPGHHKVCLLHPVTCRPVTVCFTLPHGCGCPKVKLSRREIEFDYGRREVEISFRRNGTVDVDYD